MEWYAEDPWRQYCMANETRPDYSLCQSGNATADGPCRDTTDSNAPVPARHAYAVHGLFSIATGK